MMNAEQKSASESTDTVEKKTPEPYQLVSGPFLDPDQLLTTVVGSYPTIGELTGLAEALCEAFTDELNRNDRAGNPSPLPRSPVLIMDPARIRKTMDAGMVGPATAAAIAAQLAPNVEWQAWWEDRKNTPDDDEKVPNDSAKRIDEWLRDADNRLLLEARRLDVISTGQASMTALGDMVRPFEELVDGFPPTPSRGHDKFLPNGSLRVDVVSEFESGSYYEIEQAGDEHPLQYQFVNELRVANAFLDYVQQRFPELYRPLKINFTGPATLAVGTPDLPERALEWIRAYSEFLPDLATGLAEWGLLRHMHHFQIDEPVLTVSNFSNLHPEAFTFDVPMMVRQLEVAPVLHYGHGGRVPVLIHMCGMFDPPRIAAFRRGRPYALDVELAHLLGNHEGAQQDIKGICRQLNKVGRTRLSIGVVDHTSHSAASNSVVMKLAADVRERLGKEHLAASVILTPDCGLRGLRPQTAAQKLESLRRARTLVARLNGDAGHQAHADRTLLLRSNEIYEDNPIEDTFPVRARLDVLATSKLDDLLLHHIDGEEIVERLSEPIDTGASDEHGISITTSLLNFLQYMMSECDAQLERFDHTLWQYTDHGARHSRSVMLHALSLIGGAWRHFSNTELAALLLAAYAHDLGQTYLDDPTKPTAVQLLVMEDSKAVRNRSKSKAKYKKYLRHSVRIRRSFETLYRNADLNDKARDLLRISMKIMEIHSRKPSNGQEQKGQIDDTSVQLRDYRDRVLQPSPEERHEWEAKTVYDRVQHVWSDALREIHGFRGAKLLRRFAGSYITRAERESQRPIDSLRDTVAMACWPVATHQSKARTRLTGETRTKNPRDLRKTLEEALEADYERALQPLVDEQCWIADRAGAKSWQEHQPQSLRRSELLAAIIRLADELDWGPHRTYREDRQNPDAVTPTSKEEYSKSNSVASVYVNHALQRIEVVANVNARGLKHEDSECNAVAEGLRRLLCSIRHEVQEMTALKTVRGFNEPVLPPSGLCEERAEVFEELRPLPCTRRLDAVLGHQIVESTPDDKTAQSDSGITPRKDVVRQLKAKFDDRSSEFDLGSRPDQGGATDSKQERRLTKAAHLVFKVATQVYRQLYDTGLDPVDYEPLRERALTASEDGLSARDELEYYARLSPMSSLLAIGVRMFDVVIRVPKSTQADRPEALCPASDDAILAFRSEFLDLMRMDPKAKWQSQER